MLLLSLKDLTRNAIGIKDIRNEVCFEIDGIRKKARHAASQKKHYQIINYESEIKQLFQ